MALLWALLVPTLGLASAELAKDKRCMNCHTLERKLVGPSMKDIAKRYAGQPDAVPRLAEKIIKGGAGAWGPVPMAANPGLSQAEARRLATWILGIR